jgi:hypothetical protein
VRASEKPATIADSDVRRMESDSSKRALSPSLAVI